MHERTHRRKDKKTKTKRNKIKVSKTRTHRRTDAYKEVYKLLQYYTNTTLQQLHHASIRYDTACSIILLPILVTNYYT